MISLDTNVIVRALVQDHPEQATKAQTLLVHATGAFIARTVLLEVEWVLRAAYRLPRERIHSALLGLCGLPGVSVETPEVVAQALADFAHGLDFADALHLASCAIADEPFCTFDQTLVSGASALGRRVRLA
jgi:predicted nucleic-acid-binding protein